QPFDRINHCSMSSYFHSPLHLTSTPFPYTTLFRSIRNDAHLAWRTALAKAAHTTVERVAVQSVHPHNAPFADTEAEKLLAAIPRSEEHTSELQSLTNLVFRLLLEK